MMPNKYFRLGLILSVIYLLYGSCEEKARKGAAITVFDESAQTNFAIAKLKASLQHAGLPDGRAYSSVPGQKKSALAIFAGLHDDPRYLAQCQQLGTAIPKNLRSEGYGLQTTTSNGSKSVLVTGYDPAGLMYGIQELSEQIRIYGPDGVRTMVRNPYMPWRGTKFNIPLDVRTPSYSHPSDAAQHNIGEMWSMDFWKAYIDSLASYRYNFVSLWSLHPFPSLVKVPEFPEIALDDVYRSKVQWNENYALQGVGLDDPEIVDNIEKLKAISIDEKITFWRKVMQHAKDRNITFYIVTWNIFVNGTDGKYGITDGIDNPVTVKYFRASVRELFRTYPLLGGIGLTTGENMHGASFEQKEHWVFNTYGRGVMDALAEMPGRKISFIHRQHQTGALDIARIFQPIIEHRNIDFIFSFKYAKAHVYSCTRQPYHTEFVREIQGMKTIWTLRNDDVYYFRWGAPDFVRTFINNIPYDVSRGFYLGSDQYIWGREFLCRQQHPPRDIEIAKHWYHWALWGRLGYDPTIENERFIAILQQRYPGTEAEALFTAWQNASMIYPVTTGFHWGSLDFRWYIEGCKSRPGPARTASGFHDVNRFISLPPHPMTNNLSIPEYVGMKKTEKTIQGKTPPEVSAQLLHLADTALILCAALETDNNRELKQTISDIRSMALLGKYYGHKILGATELALFRSSGASIHQQRAIAALERAAKFWKEYTDNAMQQYHNPLWTNRVGYVDWNALTEEVMHDITIAQQARPQSM